MQDRTLYRKLVDSHTVRRLDAQHVLLYADLHIMNEYTSPQAFALLQEKQCPVARPQQQLAVVSHIIPTDSLPAGERVVRDPASARLADTLRRNCEQHRIRLLDTRDPEQGIEHIVAPELGLIRPGMVVLCGDSHTTTYGALGALGFGVGTSEVAHVLATQTLAYRVARDMRIRIEGRLSPFVSAKDLVLWVISRIGAQGARGYAVEYCGSAIDELSAEARMTLCNMTVEAGARAALIAPDETTAAYLRQCCAEAAWLPEAVKAWHALRSDAAASFDAEYRFSAQELGPFVSWGTSPDQALPISGLLPDPARQAGSAERGATERALAYIGLAPGTPIAGVPVDRVFIGSCTNGRIEDLRAAAAVLRGRRIHPRVRAMVVPGSGAVRRQAEREGLARIFVEAGCEWRQPGCSMCLAMNEDMLAPGERCASTTNRNFEGRQGRAGRTHLMSPAMAAAAAVVGCIADVRQLGEAHA